MSTQKNYNSPQEAFRPQEESRRSTVSSLVQGAGWLISLPITIASVATAKMNPSNKELKQDMVSSAGLNGSTYSLGRMILNSSPISKSRSTVNRCKNNAKLALKNSQNIFTKDDSQPEIVTDTADAKKKIGTTTGKIIQVNRDLNDKEVRKSFGRAASLNAVIATRDKTLDNIYKGINSLEIDFEEKSKLLTDTFDACGSKRPDLYMQAKSTLLANESEKPDNYFSKNNSSKLKEQVESINAIASKAYSDPQVSTMLKKEVGKQQFLSNKSIYEKFTAKASQSIGNASLVANLLAGAKTGRDNTGESLFSSKYKRAYKRLEKNASKNLTAGLESSPKFKDILENAEKGIISSKDIDGLNGRIQSLKDLYKNQQPKEYQAICKKQLEINKSILDKFVDSPKLTDGEQLRGLTSLFTSTATAHTDMGKNEKKSFVKRISSVFSRGSRRNDILEMQQKVIDVIKNGKEEESGKEQLQAIADINYTAQQNDLYTGIAGYKSAYDTAKMLSSLSTSYDQLIPTPTPPDIVNASQQQPQTTEAQPGERKRTDESQKEGVARSGDRAQASQPEAEQQPSERKLTDESQKEGVARSGDRAQASQPEAEQQSSERKRIKRQSDTTRAADGAIQQSNPKAPTAQSQRRSELAPSLQETLRGYGSATGVTDINITIEPIDEMKKKATGNPETDTRVASRRRPKRHSDRLPRSIPVVKPQIPPSVFEAESQTTTGTFGASEERSSYRAVRAPAAAGSTTQGYLPVIAEGISNNGSTILNPYPSPDPTPPGDFLEKSYTGPGRD